MPCIDYFRMFRRQTLHLYRWKQECKNSQKRGEIADNGCIEWFHSVLKSETFYLHNWRNLTKDSRTDIVNLTSYFIMKLEFNRDETTSLLWIAEIWSPKKVFSSVPLLGCSAYRLAGFLGNKKTPKWSFQLVSQFSCKT